MSNNKPPFMGERVKVAEVFELQMGKTPARDRLEYWNNGDHEWVSIKDLGAYDKYVGRTKETISELGRMESGIKSVPAGTLIMSFKLSLGKAAITTKETYTNEAIMAFLDKKSFEINLNYMWHQFRSKDWGRETNAAVKGKTLNKKSLGSVEIVVPSIEVQLGVAAKLDRLLEQIEFARQEERLLDSLVKSQFVEMFGDPTNGVAWPYKRLDEICTIATGNTPPRKDPSNYGDYIEWCKTDNITDAKYLTTASEMLSEEGALRGRVVPAGSILMACIAGSVKSIGKVAVADRSVAFNQQINALIPSEMIDVEYLLWALRLSKDYLCSGVNMQLKGILNKTSLSAKSFCVPPLTLQREFASFVAEVDKSRFVVQRQIEKLQTLYDSLAQEYFG